MSFLRRRRAIVGSVAALVVVAGGLASAVVASQNDHASARTSAPVATAPTVPKPTTTVRPTTTTTTIPLPQPEAPPADPYANVPVTRIGSIQIPKIGLAQPIFQGVWLTVVDHGPGHWPGSAMPGRIGNAVFAGHRVTHTHPFLDVDQLAPGDKVIFDMHNGVFTYAVTSITIVLPSDIGIITSTRKPTMTLFACNPKHSAAQRIVVKGRLVSSQPAQTTA